MASKTTFLLGLLWLTIAFGKEGFAASYDWNGTTSGDWGTSANWTPSGIPTAGDEVTITSTGNSPVLDRARSIGTLTMTSGTLDLGGFTLDITITGTFNSGTINNGTVNASSATTFSFKGTTFGAVLSGSSSSLVLSGGTFNNEVSLSKTGSSQDNGQGGCVFKDSTTITHAGSGQLRMGGVNPDSAYKAFVFRNQSTGWILYAFGSEKNYFGDKLYIYVSGSGNTTIGYGNTTTSIRFKEDIELESSGSGSIGFGRTSTTSLTHDADKRIIIGSGGFSSGSISLVNYSSSGAGTYSLTLTGSASLTLQTYVTFTMPVNFTAPGIALSGADFDAQADFTKTGTTQSNGSGGCIFKGTTTFTYSGSGGQWRFGTVNPDTFEAPVTFTNSSSGTYFLHMYAADYHYKDKVYIKNNSTGTIHVGYQTGSNRFADDVEVENTSTGTISFGTFGATNTIDAGKELLIGSNGFASGTLSLNYFTPGGTAARSLALTGTAVLSLGAGSVYNMNITFTAPGIFFGGGTFNGESKFTKTGSSQQSGSGNCVFNDSTTFVHTGTGSWRFATSNPDTFNVAVTYVNSSSGNFFTNMRATNNYYKKKAYFRNNGTGFIYIGYQSASTRFVEDVELENTSSGSIAFGVIDATTTMDDGAELLIGSGGFSSGTLAISYFTPGGNAARSLTLTGTAVLSLGAGSLYNQDFSFTAPSIALSGGTYNATTSFTKTGSAQSTGSGGCTFSGTITITNNGTGQFRMATSSADVFNGDMFYVANTGLIYPAFTANTTYNKSITVTGASSVVIGFSTGTAIFGGSVAQNINGDGELQIRRMTVNNSSSTGLTLNTPVKITTSLTLTDGHIFTTSSNLLSLSDGATSSSGSAASYVDGPMKKIGDEDFVFPLGDENIWARLGIAGAGGSNTDEFTAQYLKLDYPDLTVTGSLTNVSYAEYWTLSRDNGTSSKTVQLFWEDHSESRIANPASTNLRVAHYNGTDWEDAGHTALTSGTSGSVTSASVSSFSPFTFGSFDQVENPLPVELLSFTGHIEDQQVALQWETATEINNDFFTLERSSNGRDGYEPIARIQGQGTTYDITSYQYTDTRPLSGSNFYRLKQTDYDGSYTYSNPVQVTFDGRVTDDLPIIIQLYPNPAQDYLHVSLPNQANQKINLEVINMLGLQVASETYQDVLEIEVPLQGLPTGAYLLRVSTADGQLSTQQFIKK